MALCEKCKSEHDGSFGSGRFCSRKCANSHIPSDDHRKKTSASLVGKSSNRRDPDGWREKLSEAHTRRKLLRAEEAKLLPYESLSLAEQRDRIKQDQGGKCMWCGIPDIWNGKPLKFDLDHIDGDHTNNDRGNLRLLCPNCHSQTPTYKKNNSDRKVTDEEFKQALIEANSIYEAMEKLRMRMNGGAYRRARRLIQQFNIQMGV